MDSLFSRIQKSNPSEKLDILLELHNQQKTPSETVLHILKEPIPVMSGKVVVRNNSSTSITIKKLSVVLLTGEGYTGHQLDVDPETADVKPLFTRPLRRNGVILWEKGKKILPGRHEFPFKVTFPASVPPTLKFVDREKCITHLVHVCARLAKDELIIKSSEIHVNRLIGVTEAKAVTKAGLASGGKIYCTLSTSDCIWIDDEIDIGKLVLATADKMTPQVYLKRVDCKLVEKVTRNTDGEPKITEKQSGPTVTYHIESENCEIDSSPSKELGISFPYDAEMQPDYSQENMALTHEVEFQMHFSTSLMANTNLVAKIRVPAVLCYKYDPEPVRRGSLQISDAGSIHERASLDISSPRSSMDEFRTSHSNRSLTSITSILKTKSSKRSGVFSFASFFKKEKSMPEVKPKVSFKNTNRKAVDYGAADYNSDSDSSIDMHPEIKAKDSMMKLKRSNSEIVKPKTSIEQLQRSNSNPNSFQQRYRSNSFAEIYNRLESITDKYEETQDNHDNETLEPPLDVFEDPKDDVAAASAQQETATLNVPRDEEYDSNMDDYQGYSEPKAFDAYETQDQYAAYGTKEYHEYDEGYDRKDVPVDDENEFQIHSVDVYQEKMPSARIEELEDAELIEEQEDEEARYNQVYGIPEPSVVQQYENAKIKRPTSIDHDVFSHGSDIPPSLPSKDGNYRDFAGDGLYSDINESKPNLQIVTGSRLSQEPEASANSPNEFDSMDIKRQSYASTIYSELSPFVQSAPIVTGRELPRLESPLTPFREKPFIQSAPIVIGGKDSNQHLDSPNSPTLQSLRSLELKKGVIRGPKTNDYRKTPGSPLAMAHPMPSPLPPPNSPSIGSPMVNEYENDYPTRPTTPQNDSYPVRPVTPQEFLSRPKTPQNDNSSLNRQETLLNSAPVMQRSDSNRTPPSHTLIDIPNEPATPSSKSQNTIPSQNTLTDKIPPRPSTLLPVFSAKSTYQPARPDELYIKAGQLCQIKEIVHDGVDYGNGWAYGKIKDKEGAIKTKGLHCQGVPYLVNVKQISGADANAWEHSSSDVSIIRYKIKNVESDLNSPFGFLSLYNITISLKQIIKIKKLVILPGSKFTFTLIGTRVYLEKEEKETDVIKDTKRLVYQINQICRVPIFVLSFIRVELFDFQLYFIDDFEYCLQIEEIVMDTRVEIISPEKKELLKKASVATVSSREHTDPQKKTMGYVQINSAKVQVGKINICEFDALEIQIKNFDVNVTLNYFNLYANQLKDLQKHKPKESLITKIETLLLQLSLVQLEADIQLFFNSNKTAVFVDDMMLMTDVQLFISQAKQSLRLSNISVDKDMEIARVEKLEINSSVSVMQKKDFVNSSFELMIDGKISILNGFIMLLPPTSEKKEKNRNDLPIMYLLDLIKLKLELELVNMTILIPIVTNDIYFETEDVVDDQFMKVDVGSTNLTIKPIILPKRSSQIGPAKFIDLVLETKGICVEITQKCLEIELIRVSTTIKTDLSFECSVIIPGIYVDATELGDYRLALSSGAGDGSNDKQLELNGHLNFDIGKIHLETKNKQDENMKLQVNIKKVSGYVLLPESTIRVDVNLPILQAVKDRSFDIVKTSGIVISQNCLGAPFIITTKDIHLDVSITKIYIGLLSVLQFIKPSQDSNPPRFEIKIPHFIFNLELPDQVFVLFKFKNNRLMNNRKDWTITYDELNISAKKNETVQLSNMIENQLEIIEGKPISLNLSTSFIQITIPHNWPMFNILENMISLHKTVKLLLVTQLNASPTKFEKGKSTFDMANCPNVFLKTSSLQILFEDDPFESKLSRNYQLAFDENSSRLKREKEFIKIAKSRLKYKEHTNHIPFELFDKTTRKAYQLLQVYDSKSYIDVLRSHTTKLPPLMETIFYSLTLKVSLAKVEGYLEDMIHQIDITTPNTLTYSDLLPLHIKAHFCGCQVRLRDYSNPILYLPQSTSFWETNGLLIVADPISPKESEKIVDIPLDFGKMINIKRNVNPTKLYTQSETVVNTSALQVCLGAAFEPCVANLITIIDNFTLPSEDPSEPVGWWDKIRILLHGSNTIKINSGDFNLRILGSMSPYFDPQKHFGVEGIEWSMSKTINITFGGETEKTEIIFECGEFKLNIPKTNTVCLGKLCGGVRIGFTIDYLTLLGGKIAEPTRSHYQVVLQTKDGKIKDSFEGFRSSNIKVVLEIQSPRKFYSDLPYSQNCLFLNTETLHGIEKIFQVYQSLITNLPVKRGNLFNGDNLLLNKPKLGRVISFVHLKTIFQPLMLSYILECEDSNDFVGLRLQADQMITDYQFRQYDVKLERTSLDRKNVTKWIREYSSLSFIEIEGRVLSYCSEDSDLYIPNNYENYTEKMNDFFNWIFTEDSQFKNLDLLEMTTCIWAPRVDYMGIENTKQTYETEKEATKTIYEIQYQLFNQRLNELNSLIWEHEQEKRLSESRGAVFFDDTNESSYKFNDVLTLLLAKRKVILDNMERCNFKMFDNADKNEIDVSQAFDMPIRNIIFRLVELHGKNSALKYCMSNAAAQVASELVETLNKEQTMKTRRESIVKVKKSFDPELLLQALLRDLEMGNNVVHCEAGTSTVMQEEILSTTSLFPPDKANLELSHPIDHDVLVRFINPQINFEVEQDDVNACVVLAAHRMQVKFLRLLDKLRGIDDEGQDNIIKFRNVWSFEETQLLVQDSAGKDKPLFSIDTTDPYPVWVPIESLLDHKVVAAKFGRIIGNSYLEFQIDKPNPLYIQRHKGELLGEEPVTYHFTVPNLEMTSTSKQYLIFYELFRNLLVYMDPARGERADRLKKTLLALEQADDIKYYQYALLALQEKVNDTEFVLKYGKHGKMLSETEVLHTRQNLSDYRQDLFILMEALKNLQIIEKQRQSLNVAWQLLVKIGKYVWNMDQDNLQPLCRWTMDELSFVWINNEDQSSINTLEIDHMELENLTSSAYRHVISPYNPLLKDINFEKHKMIRVYWRENAPVAGIQVVDHFEINIHPLLIQVTYDFGKLFGLYIFPPKEKKTPELKREERRLSMRDTPVSTQIRQMQARANENKSFIHIKVPGVQHCLSYKGSKEKNIEDLHMFTFNLPTLEYRNKTWTWMDFLQAIKKAALANTGALVREKLFVKKDEPRSSVGERSIHSNETLEAKVESRISKSTKFIKKAIHKTKEMTETGLDKFDQLVRDEKNEEIAILNQKGKMFFGKHFNIIQKKH
ncbi:hypothetical protein HDV01_006957 [Terramyces sp. JEL0728]|nr:hypothetical protein HDV01_006957 [Terramyces sp. JEL0728]